MIRSLAYYIDALLFAMPAYSSMSNSPLNQRYGDRWGKTVVVKIKEITPESRRPLAIFFLGLLAGAGSLFFLLATSIIFRAL